MKKDRGYRSESSVILELARNAADFLESDHPRTAENKHAAKVMRAFIESAEEMISLEKHSSEKSSARR